MKTLKSITLIGLMLFSASAVVAQEEEEGPRYIFGGTESPKVSGFGAFTTAFSSVNNEFAVLNGGGAALLINQTFYIGAYGEGLSTGHFRDYEVYSGITDENEMYSHMRTSFGHGGFWLGYIHNYKEPLHWGVSAKIGWGSVAINEDYYDEYNYEDYYTLQVDNAFVFSPQIEFEMNLFKWMKVNAAAGYRLVAGLDEVYPYKNGDVIEYKNYVSDGQFSAPYGEITLLFGWFNQ
jgi:hypothetical protein